jgi:hypothetical protein
MTVNQADLKQFRAQTQSDDGSNGGRMSTGLVSSGVDGALLPRVTPADMTAGFSTKRKTFFANHGSTAALGAQLYLENYTSADDELVFFAGTQSDTQAELTGSEDVFGVGQLNADITAGASSITVSVHDWALMPIFRNGVLLRVSDKADINAAGNTEFVRVHAATPITAVGNVVTIPLATAIIGNYTAASTRVASILEHGDIEATADSVVVASTAGTYDDSTNPVSLNNAATIEEVWTLSFVDATSFSAAGASVGDIGAGSVNSNFTPNNPDYAAPYFTLASAGWGGTFAPGDTLTLVTHPSALSAWVWRQAPAGAGVAANNIANIAILAGSV